jgi:hypothetical protein
MLFPNCGPLPQTWQTCAMTYSIISRFSLAALGYQICGATLRCPSARLWQAEQVSLYSQNF